MSIPGQYKGKSTYAPDGTLQDELLLTHVDGLVVQTVEQPGSQTTDYILDEFGQ